MTEALYERYKDALRRGHVAAQRGRLDEALDAYGEAARVAPDRALPLVGIAQVLVRLGKSAEALSTFDRALERAPTDEVALRGRLDALLALGDRIRAAETLDAMAEVAIEAGRRGDAVDLVAHALELAEGRDRRAALRSMVANLQGDGDAAAAAADALARAGALLAGPIGPEAPPPPPPFDPAMAMAAVEEAAATGDGEATRAAALDAARGFRAGGQLHAAIDACYQALASNPADPSIHLSLAELYIDRGWRTVAADKLVLLTSLVDVEGDRATRDRLCALAARIPDDDRLEAICA
ncbi:MAG TPA: tetratricopeptide repeat protein [Candidatus Limnocylindrales bacterium]|nr:tetratricopeptide repeat protein [Candidatus Limnocylindrales bacterium]